MLLIRPFFMRYRWLLVFIFITLVHALVIVYSLPQQTQAVPAETVVYAELNLSPMMATPKPTKVPSPAPVPAKPVTKLPKPAPSRTKPVLTAPAPVPVPQNEPQSNASDNTQSTGNPSVNTHSAANNTPSSTTAAASPPAETTAPVIQLPSSNAAYLNNPAPAYPSTSKRRNEQGTVILQVLINTNGRAEQAKIAQSSGHFRLDEAGLETVLKWRYRPGTRNGVPETMWFNIPIRFVLENN